MRIEGSKILLTGASGGIGHAIARSLHALGAELVLTGRRADVLSTLAAEVGARVVAADLADRAALEMLVRSAGPIDVLIANAALPGSGLLLDFEQDEIDRCLEVNLRAPIALCRALVPAMLEQGSGHVTFVSSLSGMAAATGTSIYSATKFGLRGFAHGARQDLHGTGVGVSVVLPGFVSDAGMYVDTGVALPKGVRTKSPRQVADAVVTTITKNRAEIVVAPAEMHAGALLATVAPGLSGVLSRRLPAARIATQMADAQRAKR